MIMATAPNMARLVPTLGSDVLDRLLIIISFTVYIERMWTRILLTLNQVKALDNLWKKNLVIHHESEVSCEVSMRRSGTPSDINDMMD